jgi:uncharacterized protein (DUF2267 family)
MEYETFLREVEARLGVPKDEAEKVTKDFIRYVAEKSDLPEDRANRAVMAVFRALQLALKAPTGQEGEAWDVLSQLPKDLKRVWLAAATMAGPKAAKAS